MRRAGLYALLGIAAAARLLMQMSAMPPYAGLDEIQHVAHLAFAVQEHRSPTTTERSIPPYLEASILQKPDAVPSFAQIGERWPDVVASNDRLVVDRPFAPSDLRPYARPNYEAQQPAFYYRIVAPLAAHASPIRDLVKWRLVSVAFAIVVVLATAAAGEAVCGEAAIAAASLLLFLPTWMTLVIRVANDALACAFVAAAFAITIRSPRRMPFWIAEGILWAGAFATKLYTWPLVAAVVFAWWRQRASRARIVTVTAIAAGAAALTIVDLMHRTHNALGVVAFDRPGGAPLDSGFHLSEILRVTIASAAWTSGQHWDALKPVAIALYALPLFVALLVAIRRVRPSLSIAVAALIAFGCAQAFNAISCVLARRAGNPVPVGGKEGWYWYVLAPVVIATVIAPVASRFRGAFVFLIAWLGVWDIVITEGALFHDYAGASSVAHPSMLFRWGPLFLPFTAHLAKVAVGPFAREVTAFRVVQIAAVAILIEFARGIRDPQPAHSRVAPREAAPSPAGAPSVEQTSR